MEFARINAGEMPPLVPSVTGTRIACILDEFSMAGFEDEADFMQLSPTDWRTELESFQPHLLLIESAWRGKDNLWTNAVSRCGSDVLGIIKWCKKRSIPTVFWNKEDPVHFATFLNLASYFDVVLTTDLDSVPRYKQLLGNESVYFFPFAAQTRVHNPIAKFSRADAFCFAGAYYNRYPDRTRALESFVSELSSQKPFLIFDRNFGTQGTQHADYKFPDSYSNMILGRLEPEEIEYAYKAFTTGVNLNSVTSSQTMLARRVYELIASDTMIVSNYSRALQTLFGDLVIASDHGRVISQRIAALEKDPLGEARLRAQALRKVLREHTYRHRVAQILGYVGLESSPQRERIGVLSVLRNQSSLDSLMGSVTRQSRRPDKVVVVTETMGLWRTSGPIALYSMQEVADSSIQELFQDIDLLAVMDPRDYYGPHYLEDLALAREYVAAPVISKNIPLEDASEGAGASPSYTSTASLDPRRALFDIAPIEHMRLGSFLELETRNEPFCNFVIDGFEYLGEGASASEASQRQIHSASVKEGFALEELQRFGMEAKPKRSRTKQLDILRLVNDFPERKNSVSVVKKGSALQVKSSLDEGKHQYVYSKAKLKVSELPWGDSGHLYIEATPGVNITVALLFLDKEQERISHVMVKPNTNRAFKIPADTRYYHFGLRVMGAGDAAVLGIYPKPHIATTVGPRTQARKIVLTNIYPSYDDLYRNGFVHSRVTAYQEKGVDVEVVRLVNNQAPVYREYNGIRVLELNKKDLKSFVESNHIDSVLVHFLSKDMYEVLSDAKLDIKVHVWVHGIEVQPWWRRKFNITTQEELDKAKKASETRVKMWGEIFAKLPPHFDFVFVSQYFANQVMDDYDVRLPEDKYRIIHNPIDTKLFTYSPKDVEQRKRVLSIRPYASRTYANDLAVEAVQLLRSEPFFEDLEFTFIGDGPLFEETLKPLREYKNVTIERRFLTPDEIVAYHKQFGIMLIPTRMDSHGVSRDEAMSSGLVPITTDVAAVPEFVDSSCGVLAPLDDAQGLAQGIKRMYENPELFHSMSAAAAARVRRQTDKDLIIARELSVLQNDDTSTSNISASR